MIARPLHDRAGFPCEHRHCPKMATAVIYAKADDEESFLGRFCDNHRTRRQRKGTM